jgi:hypothetical protein
MVSSCYAADVYVVLLVASILTKISAAYRLSCNRLRASKFVSGVRIGSHPICGRSGLFCDQRRGYFKSPADGYFVEVQGLPVLVKHKAGRFFIVPLQVVLQAAFFGPGGGDQFSSSAFTRPVFNLIMSENSIYG